MERKQQGSERAPAARRLQVLAQDRHRRVQSDQRAAEMAERATALRLPHTEVALNGRCVGQLQYNESTGGTELGYVWHDPTGCEHVLIGCEADGCGARFFLVESRQFPRLCLDHSDDASRAVDGWTPENSL